MAEPIIKAEHVKVIYNQGKANEYVGLNDVSVTMEPGEYVILFGPSGCGKSTLLYTLMGLQSATEGKIMIDDKDMAKFSESEQRAVLSTFAGIVFQQYNLVFSLNVIDNVTLPQVFLGKPRRARKKRAKELLRRFGIEAHAKRLPGMMSGGQQQRVAIARALVNDPRVLFADEPVGNLDSESAEVVMETIKEINEKDGKAIILVTHDPRYLEYADKVYFMKDAKIEREVRNPKKKKRGSGTGAEGLGLLARARPAMSVRRLKAWVVTNWLTQELTSEQLRRMDDTLEQVLAGTMSERGFFEALDRPYNEGGVGLYKTTAAKYGRLLSEILKRASTYRKHMKDLPDPRALQKVVTTLLIPVLEEIGPSIGREQMERVRAAIQKRVLGELVGEEFYDALDRREADGGAGLRADAARRAVEKLEVLLSQPLGDETV